MSIKKVTERVDALYNKYAMEYEKLEDGQIYSEGYGEGAMDAINEVRRILKELLE